MGGSGVLRVHDATGEPMAATFDVGIVSGAISLFFNSAGGKPSKEGGVARNADYAPGLEIILRRLGQLGSTITDAYVDSQRMQDQPIDLRRLDIPGWPYPIRLQDVSDFDAFRKRLTGAQRFIGKADKTKGGNERKRVRIQLEVPGFPPSSDSASRLGLILSEAASLSPVGPAIGASDATPTPQPSGGGSGGQGFISDVATKLAIEAAAMKAAQEHYEATAWTVKDVSAAKVGYDLLCERGDDRLCVEVKGTTQPPKSVLVSRNEVAFALANPQCAALFVLSDIRVSTQGGAPIASGGTPMVIEPWKVELERLSATGYNYALDGLG
jgi:hypothetical protein